LQKVVEFIKLTAIYDSEIEIRVEGCDWSRLLHCATVILYVVVSCKGRHRTAAGAEWRRLWRLYWRCMLSLSLLQLHTYTVVIFMVIVV